MPLGWSFVYTKQKLILLFLYYGTMFFPEISGLLRRDAPRNDALLLTFVRATHALHPTFDLLRTAGKAETQNVEVAAGRSVGAIGNTAIRRRLFVNFLFLIILVFLSPLC
jgi:hypothetical protein